MDALLFGEAGDEREDEDIRVWAGDILLDFGRAEHRELLFGLADSGISRPLYGRRAIRRRLKQPDVARYHRNWMRFYESRELARRRRHAEQDRLARQQAWDEALSAPWGECPGSADDPLPDPCGCPAELMHCYPAPGRRGVSWGVDKYPESTPSGRERDDSYVQSVGVDYDIQKWLQVGLDYTHRERNSTDTASFNYEDCITTLGFKAMFR